MASKACRVHFEREAEEEFLCAMEYYSAADREYSQRPILTEAFEAEIDQALTRASLNPRQFPVVGGYHRALSGNRFGYLIFFVLDDASKTIWIKMLRGPGQNSPVVDQ